MTLLLAVAAGLLTGRLLWILLAPAFASQPALLRSNYRGRPVATAAGIVLPMALLLVEGGRAVAGSLGMGPAGGPGPARTGVLVVSLGLGLAGVFDDLAGSGEARGFRGHLGALARGRLTTGGAKLVAGYAVALVAVAPWAGESPGRLVADAALVALAANLANLLDRGPGRATKASLAGFVALAVATRATPALSSVAVVMGAGFALLLDDLHERLMLGDAGANVLGGVLGLGLVLACAPSTRTTALVVVAGLNLVSEVVSFGRVIDAVPPLRAADRAGRPHRP